MHLKEQINFTRITPRDPLYQKERELRNEVLLRPIGLPDHAWEMKDHLAWHFVAEIKGVVVGCVLLTPLDDTGVKAQLMQMAVAEQWQGRGLGKLMVQELIAFARAEKLQEIICHARGNVVMFYEKLGFETYGEPFVEVGITHRYMSLKL